MHVYVKNTVYVPAHVCLGTQLDRCECECKSVAVGKMCMYVSVMFMAIVCPSVGVVGVIYSILTYNVSNISY